MALSLKINKDLRWDASNRLAGAVIEPIIEEQRDKEPRLSELLEIGLMVGLAELHDLTSHEFIVFSHGVDSYIGRRFERHTSSVERLKDGSWLAELLNLWC